MGEFFKRVLRLFGEYWSKVDINHKLTVIFLGTFLTIGALSIIYYSSKPAFGVLYGSLDSDSAASVKEFLDDEKILYKIKDGGRTIEIPKDKIYSIRLSLAGKGLPKKGKAVGFEIFDKSSLGMTEFVQKINYYRAAQGELSRTIESIEGIDAARVHIVVPEESIFKEDQKDATASIALQLRSQGILDSTQIAGIRQLVASSIEGLKANNISIIDNWGNMLAQPTSGDGSVGDIASSQIGLQKSVEKHYVRKIESLLRGVLGNNNAVVRIDAMLNFDKVEKTLESYDPESAVVRQETITSENSKGKTASGEGPPGVQANIRGNEGASESSKQESSTSREVIKNTYEIDKTISHTIQGVGEIKRLTASVFIRQRKETDEEGNIKPLARSAEDMAVFEEIVKNAVGFNEERGDRVSVKEIAFSVPEIPSAVKALEGAAKKNFYTNLAGALLAGIGAIVLVFFAISFFKKVKVEEITISPAGTAFQKAQMTASMPAGIRVPAAGAAEPVGEDAGVEIQVSDIVERQPEDASLVVKNWMSGVK